MIHEKIVKSKTASFYIVMMKIRMRIQVCFYKTQCVMISEFYPHNMRMPHCDSFRNLLSRTRIFREINFELFAVLDFENGYFEGHMMTL